MILYEYMWVPVTSYNEPNEATLNAYGKQGWRLVPGSPLIRSRLLMERSKEGGP